MTPEEMDACTERVKRVTELRAEISRLTAELASEKERAALLLIALEEIGSHKTDAELVEEGLLERGDSAANFEHAHTRIIQAARAACAAGLRNRASNYERMARTEYTDGDADWDRSAADLIESQADQVSAQAWQPPETIPQGRGLEFLVELRGGRVTSWKTVVPYDNPDCPRVFKDHSGMCWHVSDCRHWRPLPPPPQKEGW